MLTVFGLGIYRHCESEGRPGLGGYAKMGELGLFTAAVEAVEVPTINDSGRIVEPAVETQ